MAPVYQGGRGLARKPLLGYNFAVKCPLCPAEVAEDALECPSCGVIFAKLKKKKSQESGMTERVAPAATPAAPSAPADREAAEAALAALDQPPAPPAYPPWLGKAIAGGLAAAWVLGLGLYLMIYGLKPRQANPDEKVPDTVVIRDPATGNLKRLPVVVAPGARRRE